MLKVTKDMVLPTTITGSYPKPNWYNQSLHGRSFKVAMGDSLFREQYLDTVAGILTEQTMAGLDILTDGDARFDLAVGGKSWMFYALERLEGLRGRRDVSPLTGEFGIRPGHIMWEIRESYQTPVVVDTVKRGPLEYTPIWKTAQRMTTKPVKFGTVSAGTLVNIMWNQHYPSDEALLFDVCDAMNQELREVAAAGCELIQVEEPWIHFAALRPDVSEKTLQMMTEAVNLEVRGVGAEIWVHTCWGNPNQQRHFWEAPSYEKSLPYLLALDADVVTFECASSNGRDLALLGRQKTAKKIAIGVISHTNTVVEPPEVVANLIRRALEHIPPERLVISTDCGFGREGLPRRVAYYKCIALVRGTNIVRRELGLPEVPIRGADPQFAFTEVPRG